MAMARVKHSPALQSRGFVGGTTFKILARSSAFLLVFNAAMANLCADNNGLCPSWSRDGECEKNPGYMLPNCRQSCGVCGVPNCAQQIETNTRCQCNVGYSGLDGGSCVACIQGKFKATNGSQACSDCAAGKFLNASGATSATKCQNCGLNKFSAPNRTICIECPANSFSEKQSGLGIDCQCNVGFSGSSGEPCTRCAPGLYKNMVGPSVCQQCQPGSYGTNTSSSCSICPAGKTSPAGSVAIDSCLCAPGYSVVGKECVACAAGKFKSLNGSSACLACPNNSFAPDASTAITDCSCNAGFTFSEEVGRCSACAPGKYKMESQSNNNCTDCPSGKYRSQHGPGACDDCTINSDSPTASVSFMQCLCNRGYSGPNAGPCRACSKDMWKSTNGAASCSMCPSFSSSPVGSPSVQHCACNAGYVAVDGTKCEPCAAGQFGIKFPGAVNRCEGCPAGSSSAQASTKITDCICKKGYSGQHDGSVCDICSSGWYKNFSGVGPCTRCAANSYSLPGASSTEDCKCPPGHFGDVYGGDEMCVGCTPGKYKNTLGGHACSLCPQESESKVASTNLKDCQCNRGFAGPDCRGCAQGKYKNVSGDSNCLVPQTYAMACGLYCWILPYQATWQGSEVYSVDLTADEVVVCDSTCGDGMLAGLEECDDGNIKNGDGCSAACTWEDVVNATAQGSWECTLAATRDARTPTTQMLTSTYIPEAGGRKDTNTCYRNICQRTALYIEIETAKAASQAITAVLGTVIVFTVAASASSLASGFAAASIGGVTGGAATGPLILMIDQVQIISMLGQAGGDQALESTAIFSKSFRWANLKFNGKESSGTARRMEDVSTRTCDPSVGVELVNQILVTCGVLPAVSFARVGINRLCRWQSSFESNAHLLRFPVLEVPVFVLLFVGISDAATKIIVSGCMSWALLGTFIFILPIFTIAVAYLKIKNLVEKDALSFVPARPTSPGKIRYFSSRASSQGRVSFFLLKMSQTHFRGEWEKKTPEAEVWGAFITSTGSAWWCFLPLLAKKLITPLILNWTNGTFNAVLLSLLFWTSAISSLFLQVHRNNVNNRAGTLIDMGNGLATSFTAIQVALPRSKIPPWINGSLVMYCMLGSVVVSIMAAAFSQVLTYVARTSRMPNGNLDSTRKMVSLDNHDKMIPMLNINRMPEPDLPLELDPDTEMRQASEPYKYRRQNEEAARLRLLAATESRRRLADVVKKRNARIAAEPHRQMQEKPSVPSEAWVTPRDSSKLASFAGTQQMDAIHDVAHDGTVSGGIVSNLYRFGQSEKVEHVEESPDHLFKFQRPRSAQLLELDFAHVSF